MPPVAISSDEPSDDFDWRALARGDEVAQNRLVARFAPAIRPQFEANIRSAELRVEAEEETFRRVFRFFRSGHECDDEEKLREVLNGISRNVMSEIRRIEQHRDDYLRSAGNP